MINLSNGPNENISSAKPKKKILLQDKKNTKNKFKLITCLKNNKAIINERKKLMYIAKPPILTLPFGMYLLIVFLSINLFREPNLIVHGKQKVVKIKDIIINKRRNIIKT